MRAELGLEGMVELPGQLTGDAKWQAYSEADLFFFPTHYESEATPIVLMEALGSGLSILSTRWAGIPAMLEHCDTATLLPIRSPELYAEALVDLSAQRNEAAETAKVSRAFYEKHFLPERFVGRVRNAFVTASGADETAHSSSSIARAVPEKDDNKVVVPTPESSSSSKVHHPQSTIPHPSEYLAAIAPPWFDTHRKSASPPISRTRTPDSTAVSAFPGCPRLYWRRSLRKNWWRWRSFPLALRNKHRRKSARFEYYHGEHAVNGRDC